MNWLQVLFIIIGAFLFFLLVREFFSWYWKMNEISAKQSKTNELLEKQNGLIAENNAILQKFVDDFTNQ